MRHRAGIVVLMRDLDAHFARTYIRRSSLEERRGGAAIRSRLIGDISGNILEIGAGQGLNFKHFKSDKVGHVAAVEPGMVFRNAARDAIQELNLRNVSLIAGLGEALPFADNTFDAAVMTLVLCSVARPLDVLSEIRRVLKPEGMLLFYEHVVAENWAFATAQSVIEPLWRRIAGNCHLKRDAVSLISAAGFKITECEHVWFFPRLSSYCAGPRVLGRAHTMIEV